MSDRDLPKAGDVYVVPWPFMRDQDAIDENNRFKERRDKYLVEHDAPIGQADAPDIYDPRAWEWKPGMKIERDHDYGGRFEEWTECHGMGRAEFTVVSTHRPSPRYDHRIFYKVRWCDPDGRVMGGKDLKVKTLKRFKNVEKGLTVGHWDVEVDEYAVSRAFGTRVIECSKCGRPKQADGDEDSWTCGICESGIKRWTPPAKEASAREGEG